MSALSDTQVQLWNDDNIAKKLHKKHIFYCIFGYEPKVI